MSGVALAIIVLLLGILPTGRKEPFCEGAGSNRALVLDRGAERMAPVVIGKVAVLLVVFMIGQQEVDGFGNIGASCFLQPVVKVTIGFGKV